MSRAKASKSETIRVRVSPPLRADIERLAAEQRRTTSDYLRLLISDAIAGRPTVQTSQTGASA